MYIESGVRCRACLSCFGGPTVFLPMHCCNVGAPELETVSREPPKSSPLGVPMLDSARHSVERKISA